MPERESVTTEIKVWLGVGTALGWRIYRYNQQRSATR